MKKIRRYRVTERERDREGDRRGERKIRTE